MKMCIYIVSFQLQKLKPFFRAKTVEVKTFYCHFTYVYRTFVKSPYLIVE